MRGQSDIFYKRRPLQEALRCLLQGLCGVSLSNNRFSRQNSGTGSGNPNPVWQPRHILPFSTNNFHRRKLSDYSFWYFPATCSIQRNGFPAETQEPEVETQIRFGNLEVFSRFPQITFMVENSPTIPSGTSRQRVYSIETVFPPKLRNRKWKLKSGLATSEYFYVLYNKAPLHKTL